MQTETERGSTVWPSEPWSTFVLRAVFTRTQEIDMKCRSEQTGQGGAERVKSGDMCCKTQPLCTRTDRYLRGKPQNSWHLIPWLMGLSSSYSVWSRFQGMTQFVSLPLVLSRECVAFGQKDLRRNEDRKIDCALFPVVIQPLCFLSLGA